MESHVQRPCGHKGRDMEEELENLKEDQRVTGRNVAGLHLMWPERPPLGSRSSTQIVGSHWREVPLRTSWSESQSWSYFL